jgi:hypothetical protein
MTTLDERLRDATDALGDGPRVAPSFDALRRGHRARRRRSALTAAVAIVVVCGAVAFAVRGTHTRSTNPVAPTTGRVAPTSTSVASTSTSTPTRPPAGVQPLADMPRLPTSAVHTVHLTYLTHGIQAGPAVFAEGSLWFVGSQDGCTGYICPWLFRADPNTGEATPIEAHVIPMQGSGPVAVGDGAVFVVRFNYDGSPLRVTAIDVATQAERWETAIPGTSVQGNPKTRIAFGDGVVWVSMGTMPVVELDPRTGGIVATIPLPENGAETNGEVLTPTDRFGLWVVGGDSGTDVMLVDPSTHRAEAVTSFGAGFTQSLAADDTTVWTTHFAGNPARLDLVRVDLAHPTDAKVAGIPTPQVAVGDGQVWFLGYEPGLRAADPANHYGVVGRIDPKTLKVVGMTELPGVSSLDELQLFAADGSAWVFHYAAGTITRITPPTPVAAP